MDASDGPGMMYESVSLVAVLAIALLACHADDDGGDDGQLQPTEGFADGRADAPDRGADVGGAAEANDEDVELRVWFTRDDGVPPDEFESFHAAQDDVSVAFDVVPADAVFTRLMRMSESGEGLPDLVHMDGTLQNIMYEAGIAVDITEQVERWEREDPESFGHVSPAAWELGTWNGRIVGLANTARLGRLLVRTDWLEQVDVEWPDNYEGMTSALQEVRGVMDDGYPYVMCGDGGGAKAIIERAIAMGVEHDENNIPEIDSEEGRAFLGWHLELLDRGLMHPGTFMEGSGGCRSAFHDERAAVLAGPLGDAVDAEEAGLAYGENYEFRDYPIKRTPEGDDVGERTAWFRSWQITTEKNAYEASLVLRYLAAEQQAFDVSLQGGGVPRTVDVLDNDQVAREVVGLDENLGEVLADAGGPPLHLDWFRVKDTWELMFEELGEHPDIPADELATKWQAEFDAI